jgi:putative transcriptional regulator
VKPSLLIASPQMKDPFFERTVVLVWQYDAEGAIGVIVNRTLEESAERGLVAASSPLFLPDVLVIDDDTVSLDAYADSLVGWGGPVDTDSGTIVARAPLQPEEGWRLSDELGVTRSQDALLRLAREGATLQLCLGYAGWGPGQLDREIEEGSWLFTDLDPALVFDVPNAERYDRAFAALGVKKEWVWMMPISE